MEQSEQETCTHPEACNTDIQSLQGIPTGHDGDVSSYQLDEGKGIGPASAEIGRDVVLAYATTRGASFNSDKSKARSSARKKLERVLTNTYNTLIKSTESFTKKRISFKNYSDEFKSTLRKAYYRAYALGLQSTGAHTALTAGGNPLMLPADKKWVEGALRQEMRYLNRLLKDIKNNKFPKKWPHRIGMYVASVGSIYYAGRVAATPANHALFWISKIDNKICPQCKYMSAHSPFTKYTIPITPASGHTRCLSNCRCKIVVRPVNLQYYNRLQGGVTRATHLRRLKKALR